MFTLQWDMILFGCIGGVAVELLRIVKNFQEATDQKSSNVLTCLLSMLILAVIGGLAVFVIGTRVSSVWKALFVGYVAPEVLSRLAATRVQTLIARGAKTGSLTLMEWWAR